METPTPSNDPKSLLLVPTEEDTVIKRIWRGMKILYGKLCDSSVVKNLQAEQAAASEGKVDDMMPKGFGDFSDNSQFETDFSKVGTKL